MKFPAMAIFPFNWTITTFNNPSLQKVAKYPAVMGHD